jgi:MFS family permease
VLGGLISVGLLYLLAIVQGVGVALDFPTRQSFLGQLVAPTSLTNAVALNAGVAQLARIVGPALAGGLIASIGAGWCFAVNAGSYAVILLLLLRVDRSALRARPRIGSMRGQAMAGIRYAWGAVELRTLLLVAVAFAVFGGNVNVLLPLLAKQTFRGGAGLYGTMGALLGVGALAATIFAASRIRPTKATVFGAMAALGAALAAAAAARPLWLEVAALVLIGFTSVTVGVGVNASLQLGAAPAMRGRVVALFFLIANGSNAVGGPMSGAIAQAAGVRASLAVNAAVVLVASAILGIAWSRRLGEPSAIPHAAVETSG